MRTIAVLARGRVTAEKLEALSKPAFVRYMELDDSQP